MEERRRSQVKWEEDQEDGTWNLRSEHLGLEHLVLSAYWSRIIFFNAALKDFREGAVLIFSGRVFQMIQ